MGEFGAALLLLAGAVALLASAARGQPATGGEPKVRVLLLQGAQRQRAVEEAAALSLERANRSQEQASLASLTLGQRRARAPPEAAKPPPPPQSLWSETYMRRLKPSWLNVSSQFKITGSSIEELDYMMPVEYMLRQAFDSPVLLKTKLGILEGVRSIRFNKHLYSFLGVPYARPPVDELRFRAPQPVGAWEGILQATKWPPFCVQPSMTLASRSSPVHVLSQLMSEDCLYLNVWSPSLKLSKSRPRPVMVWLHGGAFQYGGISVDENDGSALALLGDVVVVTLNYRVSAFGFLNANQPELAPNNVGLLDQRRALEWVRDHIRQFGGDPQQVTLFGESAGGHSVGLHMISPASQPLFRRAILQSGVPTSYLRAYDANPDNTGATVAEGVSSLMLARRVGCADADTSRADPEANSTSRADELAPTDEDQEQAPLLSARALECMRAKSSLEILKAMGAPGSAGFFPTGADPRGFFPHGPIMEAFEPETLRVGPQKDYLVGVNADEGTFMLHYGLPSVFPAREEPRVASVEALKSALVAEIERLAAGAANRSRSEALSASGANGGAQAHLYRPLLKTSTSVLESFMARGRGNESREFEFGRSVASLITDIIFLCPARSLARTLAEAGRNVYFYVYAHRSSLSQYHRWLGVTHHDEVEFVFGRPLRLADAYSGADVDMSQRMVRAWAQFARTGQMPEQLGVAWPRYEPEGNEFMRLAGGAAEVGERYHDRVCNVYDTVIAVHLQDS